jgi:hypothetical protein
MYDELWLMVPTYKRVEWINRLVASALEMADDPSRINFCFCVNAKDAKSIAFVNELEGKRLEDPRAGSTVIVKEKSIQPNLSLYFNMMYDAVLPLTGGDCVVSMLGDDMEFATKGYDTRLLDEINKRDGLGVFWCNDGYVAGSRCCVNLFVTKKMVDLTGRPFMCPLYRADMIDAVWWWIGAMTGTHCYLSDVVIKHLHNTSLPAYDETFRRLRPLQVSANSPANQQLGKVYATIVAGNLIAAGCGSWAKL